MERRYIKSFQGLRFFAMLLIFIAHSGTLLLIAGIDIFGPKHGYGTVAVTLFFMLSGYLAQMKFAGGGSLKGKENLARECGKSYLHALKAYLPLHLGMLAVSLFNCYEIFITSPAKASVSLILQIFLVQSWCPDRTINSAISGVSWFLSALVFLVAISPLLVRAVSKFKGAYSFLIAIFVVCIKVGMAFAYQGLSAVLWNGTPAENYQVSLGYWLSYNFPLARVADYVLGCALFQIVELYRDRMKSVLCNVIFFACFLIGLFFLYLGMKANHNRLFDDAVWLLPCMGILFAVAIGDEKSKFIQILFANRFVVFFRKCYI